MLDLNLSPISLEVNHTPSFATESDLDWNIKYDLIWETLILMNINIRNRNKTKIIEKKYLWKELKIKNYLWNRKII